MSKRTPKILSSILVSGVFTLASVLAFGGISAQAAVSTPKQAQTNSNEPHKNPIVGTWLATYDGGVHHAYAQYAKGGTSSQLVDFAAKTGNALLGDWKANDDGSISVFLTGWTFDNAGDNLTGYFTKSETDTVSGDSYTGTFEVTFYDLAGNIQFQHDGTMTAARTN